MLLLVFTVKFLSFVSLNKTSNYRKYKALTFNAFLIIWLFSYLWILAAAFFMVCHDVFVKYRSNFQPCITTSLKEDLFSICWDTHPLGSSQCNFIHTTCGKILTYSRWDGNTSSKTCPSPPGISCSEMGGAVRVQYDLYRYIFDPLHMHVRS